MHKLVDIKKKYCISDDDMEILIRSIVGTATQDAKIDGQLSEIANHIDGSRCGQAGHIFNTALVRTETQYFALRFLEDLSNASKV